MGETGGMGPALLAVFHQPRCARTGWEQGHNFFPVSLAKSDVIATAAKVLRKIMWILRDF